MHRGCMSCRCLDIWCRGRGCSMARRPLLRTRRAGRLRSAKQGHDAARHAYKKTTGRLLGHSGRMFSKQYCRYREKTAKILSPKNNRLSDQLRTPGRTTIVGQIRTDSTLWYRIILLRRSRRSMLQPEQPKHRNHSQLAVYLTTKRQQEREGGTHTHKVRGHTHTGVGTRTHKGGHTHKHSHTHTQRGGSAVVSSASTLTKRSVIFYPLAQGPVVFYPCSSQ